MGIKHRADSGFRKFSALSKLGFGRTSKVLRNALRFIPEPLAVMRKNVKRFFD
jgi:hypothetical protein